MTKFALLGAAAVLSTTLATPVVAQGDGEPEFGCDLRDVLQALLLRRVSQFREAGVRLQSDDHCLQPFSSILDEALPVVRRRIYFM